MASSIKGLKEEIALIWSSGLVPIVWGPPGVGKSAAIKQLAASQSYTIPENERISSISPRLANIYGRTHVGRPISDVRLVLCSPNDLKGIPVYVQEDRCAVWTMSGLFPASVERLLELEDMLYELHQSNGLAQNYHARFSSLERKIEKAAREQFGIIFLDELTQATGTVQAAAYSLILDKKIGEYEVPPGVNIIAASNRLGDGSMTNKMPTALKSRLVHLEVEIPLIDDFEQHAIETGMSNDVIGYLKFHPENLFKFNPRNLRGENSEMAEITFPCPRTWDFASNIIERAKAIGSDEYVLDTVLSGAIGAGAASEFIAWQHRYRKLPPCEEVLSGRMTRNQIKFTRFDGDREVADMSMEYTYIMECFRKLIDEKNESKDRVDNLIDFVMDASNTTVDWGIILFKLTQEAWIKSTKEGVKKPNAQLIITSDKMRAFASKMVKEGTF